MATSKETPRQHKSLAALKSKGQSSSFYERNEKDIVVENLQELIHAEYHHEVDMCDYLIRGRDHLGQRTIN